MQLTSALRVAGSAASGGSGSPISRSGISQYFRCWVLSS